jgi:hypothetical protein
MHLGRDDARARFEAFARDFPPLPENDPLVALAETNGTQIRDLLADLTAPTTLVGSLLRDQYLAEAFLSVDAVEEGASYFTERMAAAKRDEEKLSKAFMLSQLLLLQKKYDAYADLAADVIGPLVMKGQRRIPTPQASLRELIAWAPEAARAFGGMATLAPLADPEFLAGLRDQSVRRVCERARELRPSAQEATRRTIDVILWAAAGRLGLDRERREAEDRLSRNGDFNPKEFAREFRETRRAFREGLRVP